MKPFTHVLLAFCLIVGVSALVWVGCSPDRDNVMLTKHDLAGTDLDPNVDYDFSTPQQGPDDLNPATHDPVTCAEAEMSKSYIGCDYWPTVAANVVWSVF